jgi:hypothetical protein
MRPRCIELDNPMDHRIAQPRREWPAHGTYLDRIRFTSTNSNTVIRQQKAQSKTVRVGLGTGGTSILLPRTPWNMSHVLFIIFMSSGQSVGSPLEEAPIE